MLRAVSSVGRALPWHGRGQEFESPTVHQENSFLRNRYYSIIAGVSSLSTTTKVQNNNYKKQTE